MTAWRQFPRYSPWQPSTTISATRALRERVSLVVQAGDVQEGHDIACLVAFGADAVHPYLMLRLVRNGLKINPTPNRSRS